MRYERTAAAVGLLVATAVFYGTSSVGRAPSDPTINMTGVALASEPSLSELKLLDAAEQHLTRECMQRRGFSYRVTPIAVLPDDRDFPYVIDDPVWAERHGYGTDLRRQAERLREADPNLRYLQGLTPERRLAAINALNGTGPAYVEAELPTGGVVRHYSDGCAAHARAHLYADLGAWYRAQKITDNLRSLRRSRVATDPAVAAVLSRWAACMHSKGQPFATPDTARAALPHTDTVDARLVEIRRAVAEATCAQSSGLARTAVEVDRATERALNAEYRLVQRQLVDLQRSALPRARQALDI